MIGHRHRWLRVTLRAAVGAQVVLVGGRVLVEAQLLGTELAPRGGAAVIFAGALSMLAFPLVGVLLLQRRPEHRVGWLFCLANLGWAITTFSGAYVRLDAVNAGQPLPARDLAVWLFTWPPHLAVLVYVLVLLTFPSGRLPSPRWRLLARVTVVLMATAATAAALAPGPVDPSMRTAVDNPFGVGSSVFGPLLHEISTLGYPIGTVLLLAGIASVVHRYRRSGGVERLQLKWFVSGAVVWAVLLGGQLAVAVSFPDWDFPLWALSLVLAAHLGGGVFPVAAGVAILRYRLYEIDRLISRTVSYALVVAVLGGVYLGGVLLLAPLVGHGSDLAIAGATLAVAALFQPARRRIQAAVDRRFNRSRYDGARIVEAFAARLRDEVGLDQISQELVGAVHVALQPASASVWLRERTGS